MAEKNFRDLLLIFAGGGAGAVLRVLLDVPEFGPWMPANFLACFLMGLSSGILMEGWMSPAAASSWAASPPFRFSPSLRFSNFRSRFSLRASGFFCFSRPFSPRRSRAT